MKCLQTALSLISSIQSYPGLPTLLAALKSNMAMGLPGQAKIMASIQPPLSIPPSLLPAQHQSSSPKQKPQSVAGPHPRKKQHRNKSRDKNVSSAGKEKTESGSSGAPTLDHSSDSDSTSVSVGMTPSTGVGKKERYRRPQADGTQSLLYSSSESDLSDSEPAPNRLKFVNGKIRFQAHSCLAAVFQVCITFQ